MELILNLVWLFIAIALVCVWRTQWIHQKLGRAHGRVQQWSAVSLALVLLFFAVSMSDDIHAEIVALEELSSNRRDHVHAAVAHPAAEPTSTPHPDCWAVATRPLLPGDAYAVGTTPPTNLAPGFIARLGLKPDRAPPIALL
jgi:hypothetical protein